MNLKNEIKWTRTFILVAVISVIAFSFYHILQLCGFTSKEGFIQLRDSLGDSIWFWVVVALLQIIQVIFIPVSNQIITVPLAVIFPVEDLWKVFLTSWLGVWSATVILYFIGRLGGQKLLSWVLNDKEQTEKCANFLKKGWIFYPIGMLLPLPDDIITVLAGTAKMPVIFVVCCSLLTRAVDISCSVWGLGFLTRFWWGWLVLAGGVILLGLATFLFYKLRKEKKI